jgi:two-component system response regulator VicR
MVILVSTGATELSSLLRMEGELDPKRILVVDDDGPMLRTHGRVLEAHGFRPVLMPDPAEGLAEALRETPAVIVIELVMAGMSGLELVSRLRLHYGVASPPVVLVSASHGELSRLEQLLFDVILPRPYAIETLIHHVRRLAREHADRRQAPSGVVRRGAARDEETEENEG